MKSKKIHRKMTQNWTKMTSLDSQPTPALTQQKNNQKML
jgi:hypothetical protein